MHHVHGIVNVLASALWAGAICEMLPAFEADRVWDRLASGEPTLFMAVPTIYRKLIAAWEGSRPQRQRRLSDGAGRFASWCPAPRRFRCRPSNGGGRSPATRSSSGTE